MKLCRLIVSSLFLSPPLLASETVHRSFFSDVNVQETLEELRNRCAIYEQHDQIYPFKIKIHFRGKFTKVASKPYCATFGNEGQITCKVSMKLNRFRTPDAVSAANVDPQTQLACTQYRVQRFEVGFQGPLLTFELPKCSEITAENIRQQVVRQLSDLVQDQGGAQLFQSGEEVLQDTCKPFSAVAKIAEGECPKT